MTDAIKTVIEAYVAAWNARDPRALARCWVDDDAIYYLAEEIEAPIRTRTELWRYWESTCAALSEVRITTGEVGVQRLSTSLAVATYPMQVSIRLADSKPIGVDVEVSAILRRDGEDWRLLHYVEATLGPLPFLRRVYERNAAFD